MKKYLVGGMLSLLLLAGCNKDKEITNSLNDYSNYMTTKGYNFGDKLDLPKNVTDNAESITISFGDKELNKLVIDPAYFTLGENDVTYNIKKKNGEVLQQDATINVFAKNAPKSLTYEIVADYPHDTKNFTEGFFLDGNTIYESVGLAGKSKLMKYSLGSTTPALVVDQPADIFSEGISIMGDKLYQLTYQTKIGFIYDKNTFKLLNQFKSNGMIAEGWGLTTDGKNLITTDGTKNIYFLDPADPSKMIRFVAVADNNKVYDSLNEVEYHKGFIYSNVWQKPIILKINPATGEIAGIFDLTKIVNENLVKDDKDAVLNGIAFKGNNMLITGKNWSKIYELKISE
ncbi:glutaminyl-peptide cyclotransferase [Halpernia frigidisoli]|uniref:Glutamine cyclotransferase n=1 Tax=Halpernia frigidisoli TaxID=1125876 RepID=A0A1I3E9F9_9FLAO|nr:glutaminyl-peptide cyclotransferase [Halpernia frigidisoli]SFH95585.1 Glutamine cyclotransferase [Halpernia frigidisoli]